MILIIQIAIGVAIGTAVGGWMLKQAVSCKHCPHPRWFHTQMGCSKCKGDFAVHIYEPE